MALAPGVKLGERVQRMAAVKGLIGQMARYGAVVAVGFLLAIGFYTGEIDVGVPPYLALGIVFVLNGIFNFSLLRAWAFPPSGRSLGSDLRRFSVVAAGNFVVNYSSFAVLYSAIGLHATTAQRLAIVIAAPVTFLANRLWSFRARRSNHDERVAAVRETVIAMRSLAGGPSR
jgi:putative flippase GtrA